MGAFLKIGKENYQMVSSTENAKEVVAFFLGISGQIDGFLATEEKLVPTEEFKLLRRACGHVLAEIYTEVLNPLFNAHPEITPEELK